MKTSITTTLAAAAILAAGMATAGAQQLTGRYTVIGDNGNGTGYRGVAVISGTAGGTPRRLDSIRSASMTAATSISCGQRVVQVWQDAHSQIVLLSSTCASSN